MQLVLQQKEDPNETWYINKTSQ